MKLLFSLLIFTFFILSIQSQVNLPSEVKLTDDGRLVYGGNENSGLYKIDEIHKMEILLENPDWFVILDGTNGPNGTPAESLIGQLIFNDEIIFDSVIVSIKGATSDRMNDSEKKSFSIKIDDYIDQELLGYDNLNLNCAFQDHSSMREVLFYDLTKHYTPSLKGNFVDLYINGQSWGPYNNIQQIEGTYIKEWFQDNEGTRWRANPGINTGGPGGGGGGMDYAKFGAGVSSLNYNGSDSTDYVDNYTVKKTEKANPWLDLIDVCDLLNNSPIEDLYDVLNGSLDIDRTLWHLAKEVIFSDDDSYIHKGGMDYYVYWDNFTDRLMPLEVDGNSVMNVSHANWELFYHSDDNRYPLLHRMLENEEIRQRYLAHVRTILGNFFIEEPIHQRIDELANMIDQRIQDDPKKIYSYDQFMDGLEILKNFISERIIYLNNDLELNRLGVDIAAVNAVYNDGGVIGPKTGEEVMITVMIEGDVSKVKLYYGVGLDGSFDRIEMYDDGLHNDGEAGDNIYSANIPGFQSGTYVRYYVEAIKNDAFSTATYEPKGAEHEVYVYKVEAPINSNENIVINEFLASNESIVADNEGEYDDWIELYNNGSEIIDLSGYYLSDDEGDLMKWQLPNNTLLSPDDYLIIWADNDEEQSTVSDLHANFKISSGGETLLLSNSALEIVDLITFEVQETDLSFARLPNGSGDFSITTPTFNSNNENPNATLAIANEKIEFLIFPNPSDKYVTIVFSEETMDMNKKIELINILGQTVLRHEVDIMEDEIILNITNLKSGVYSVLIFDQNNSVVGAKKMIINHK